MGLEGKRVLVVRGIGSASTALDAVTAGLRRDATESMMRAESVSAGYEIAQKGIREDASEYAGGESVVLDERVTNGRSIK